MIILRYFFREIMVTTLVISFGWLLFTIGQRFGRYLEQAWEGDLSPNVLFTVLVFRIPEFLTLILPLSLFLGVLVAYGRLYVDSEMVVLSSCGFSRRRLIGYTLVPAGLVAAVVALLVLFVSPAGLERVQDILSQQKNRSELEILSANRFQQFSGNEAVIYFQSFNASRDKINNVFIAEMEGGKLLDGNRELSMITARQGEDWRDPDSGQRYLLLHDGYLYLGQPGEPDYQEQKFDRYGIMLREREAGGYRRLKIENLPTAELLEQTDPGYKAELQWRLSLPLMLIIATLIAIPLSHTNPRQGRFLKMLPAFVLFMVYLALLVVGKGWIEEGKTPVKLGLWWVHGIYLTLAIALLLWNNGKPLGSLFRPKPVRGEAAAEGAGHA